jgi:Fe2+ or Zn2+ uptake regulation protein
VRNTKPITAEELLYQVKRGDLSVSMHGVYKTLKLLVKSSPKR